MYLTALQIRVNLKKFVPDMVFAEIKYNRNLKAGSQSWTSGCFCDVIRLKYIPENAKILTSILFSEGIMDKYKISVRRLAEVYFEIRRY